ncbi:MAG: DMT family protein [Hyphomicrobiales bacterium]|nr:DMT family protein [Hyphomicrobiales bacterium]
MPSVASFSTAILPIAMLVVSNVFMTFAWYGHLAHPNRPLWLVVTASWGIAFFEYCVAVPANRWGHAFYSAIELKTIQEVVTLTIFGVFSVVWLKEPLAWNHALGFGLIALGAALVFQKF